MTKTEHYQLNQWDASDPIRREDFNRDNAAIDAALGALSAQRICVGSFVGDGTSNRVIDLPWAPTFALVLGYSNVRDPSVYFLVDGCTYYYFSSYWVNSTDSITFEGATMKIRYADLNPSDRTMRYILFR